MKKIIRGSSFMMVLMIVFGCLKVSAAITLQQYDYLNTNFNNVSGQENWDGWSRRDDTNYAAGNTSIVSDYANFATTSTKGWLIEKTLSENLSGIVTFEFRFRLDKSVSSGGINLFSISAPGSAGQVSLMTTTSGYIKSTADGSTPPAGVTPNTSVRLLAFDTTGQNWSKCKIIVNFDTNAVEYYINDNKIIVDPYLADGDQPIPTQLQGNFNLPAAKGLYNTVKFYMSKNSTTPSTTCMDDIKIYKTIEVDDEPIKVNYYLNSVDETNKITSMSDGNIIGVVNYHNTSTTAKSPKAIMTLYKGTELKRISISTEDTPVVPDGNGILICNFNYALEQGEDIADYHIKVFVWESIEDMKPLLGVPSEL